MTNNSSGYSSETSTGEPVPRVDLFGIKLDCVSMDETLQIILGYLKSQTPHYVVTPNLHFIALAEKDRRFDQAISNADLSLADGMPLLWISRLKRLGLRHKVSGSDLTPRLCEALAATPWSVFFLGTTDEVCLIARDKLTRAYPGLRIAGHYSPPHGVFDEAERLRIERVIGAAQPDVVLVALGNPKQEIWMAENCHKLGIPVALGIGCSLDFISGRVRRAPVWMQNFGLEWLYRIYSEPKRLAPRYFEDLRVLFLKMIKPVPNQH